MPAGGALTYTLSAGNGGTKGVATLLSLPLPTGTSFVSATGGGAFNGSLIEWDLGTLAPGVIQQRQVSLKVADEAGNGRLLVGAAELLDPSSRRTLVRESTANLVADDNLLSLSMTANPTTVSPSSTIVYTVKLTNNSTQYPYRRVRVPRVHATLRRSHTVRRRQLHSNPAASVTSCIGPCPRLRRVAVL